MHVFGALLTILACVSSAFAQTSDQTKVILASDKKTQITVPSTWQPLTLNDTAEIQIGNEDEGCFIIVLNEAKEDLYGWNLDKHSRVGLGNLLSNIAFPTITGPKSVTINGQPAVQYEVRGAAENRNLAYIHTTVDGAKFFSQIIAWTVPSKLEAARPKLLSAIATFRETK
jgi:hypothetical protein